MPESIFIFIVIVLLAVGAPLSVILWRVRHSDLWAKASQHPDEAYHCFKSSQDCVVFERGVPMDYRDWYPPNEWTGPFSIYVQKQHRLVYFLVRSSHLRQVDRVLTQNLKHKFAQTQRLAAPKHAPPSFYR